jgi:hypothetical protein
VWVLDCFWRAIRRRISGEDAAGVGPTSATGLDGSEGDVVLVGNSPDHGVVVERAAGWWRWRLSHQAYWRAVVLEVDDHDSESVVSLTRASGAARQGLYGLDCAGGIRRLGVVGDHRSGAREQAGVEGGADEGGRSIDHRKAHRDGPVRGGVH